jgi:hypothetical protein
MFTKAEKERVFEAYRTARECGKDATDAHFSASRALRSIRPTIETKSISIEAVKIITQHPDFLRFAQRSVKS